MLTWRTLLVCVSVVVCSNVASAFYTKKSSVVSLTPKNFNDFVGVRDDEPVLVEFYAPWCGHCKNLKPHWESAAKQLDGIVTIAAVDCDSEQNKGLAQKYGVTGFPTIKLFYGKRPPEDYQGAREAKGIVDFVTSKLSSKHITVVKSDNEADFHSSEQPRVLLFSDKRGSSSLYKSLSTRFSDRIDFGEVRVKKDKKLADKYDVGNFPTVLAFAPGETKPTKYSGPLKAKNLSGFLRQLAGEEVGAAAALTQLHDQSCLQEHCVKGGNLCAVLITSSDKDESKRAHDIMKQVEDNRDDELFTFVQLDGTKPENAAFATKAFDALDLGFVRLVLLSAKKKAYATFMGGLNVDSVEEFLRGVLTRATRVVPISAKELPELPSDTEKCKPKKKPRAERGSGSDGRSGGGGGSGIPPDASLVAVLSQSNFSEIVGQRRVPMMVEFYAPWCGHCKSLAPEWEKAARNLETMVTFAKVDATVEQSLAQEFGVRGYPTIKYFGIGGKDTEGPLTSQAHDYEGQRTAKALASHATGLLAPAQVPYLQSNVELQNWMGENVGKPKVLLFSAKKKVPTLIKALSLAFDEVAAVAVVSADADDLMSQFQVEKAPQILALTESTRESTVQPGATEMQVIPYQAKFSFIGVAQWLAQIVGTAGGGKKGGEDAPAEPVEGDNLEVPLMFSQEDFQKQCLSRLGLCGVAFFDEEATNEALAGASSYVKTLESVVAKIKTRTLRFVWVPRTHQDELIKAFDVSDGSVNLVVMNARKLRYANFIGSFTEENVNDFVGNVMSGLVRTSKIDAIPALNDVDAEVAAQMDGSHTGENDIDDDHDEL